MVRVVGGTIHKVVPATADITRNAHRTSIAVTKDETSLSDSTRTTPSSFKSRQSLPVIFSPQAAKHGSSSNGKNKLDALRGKDGPTLPVGVDPDLKFGAKPSEIRAAAKQNRDKFRLEQERKDKIRQREAEAALRMKKIKDEIDSIKTKELEQAHQDQEAIADVLRERGTSSEAPAAAATALESSSSGAAGAQPAKQSAMGHTTTNLSPGRERPPNRPPSVPARQRSRAEEQEIASRGTKELALEEMMAEKSAARRKSEDDEQRTRMLGGKALTEMNDYMDMPMDELDFLTKQSPDVPISVAVLAKSPPPPSRKSLERTRSGILRSKGAPKRTPSNAVPEMRRRANQRDLLFDEDDQDQLDGNRRSATVGDIGEAAKAVEAATGSGGAGSAEPKSTPAATKATDEDASKSKPKSSMMAARQARDAAKVEEENRIKEEQRVELDNAKNFFDKGHDLCWKENNSAAALVEYRKALFIRESVLGKYHEETGRSYFWIAKSLTKLRDYDEALMAFSRAMRIFQRVLHKSNKYNIWSVTAVESVFRQMDDPSVDFTTYKESLEESIRLEQLGDQLRKKGKLAEAIIEYREAIDNLEEYHPDAADLYCKIAIILRQQGEFDRALEEYRFASEIYELSLGAEHPETVKTLNQLIEKKKMNQKSLALMEKLNMRKGP